jgi:hypothetical protein
MNVNVNVTINGEKHPAQCQQVTVAFKASVPPGFNAAAIAAAIAHSHPARKRNA